MFFSTFKYQFQLVANKIDWWNLTRSSQKRILKLDVLLIVVKFKTSLIKTVTEVLFYKNNLIMVSVEQKELSRCHIT